MSMERDRALGRFMVLRKKAYELGIKAQSLLSDIHEETNTLLTGKDFMEVDFKKIKILADECISIKNDFSNVDKEMKELDATYDLKKER